MKCSGKACFNKPFSNASTVVTLFSGILIPKSDVIYLLYLVRVLLYAKSLKLNFSLSIFPSAIPFSRVLRSTRDFPVPAEPRTR